MRVIPQTEQGTWPAPGDVSHRDPHISTRSWLSDHSTLIQPLSSPDANPGRFLWVETHSPGLPFTDRLSEPMEKSRRPWQGRQAAEELDATAGQRGPSAPRAPEADVGRVAC